MSGKLKKPKETKHVVDITANGESNHLLQESNHDVNKLS